MQSISAGHGKSLAYRATVVCLNGRVARLFTFFTYCKTKMDFGNFLELTYERERDRPRPCSLCKEFDSPKKEIKYIMNDKRTVLNLQNLYNAGA